MRTPDQALQHQEFVKALQHEAIPCGRSDCPGPVQTADLSLAHERVKTFQFTCERCGWQDRVAGQQDLSPPWDEASLQEMAYEHLMHLPTFCPFDHTPIVFVSMPNPRRKARYRLTCFYCGRQAEMDWPPPEARR